MNKFFLFIFIMNALTCVSHANMSGSSVQTFNPALNGSGEFISLYSTSTIGKKRLGATSYLDFAQNTLPTFISQNGNQSSEDSSVYSHLMLYYGLSDKIDIGLSSTSILDQETSETQNQSSVNAKGILNIKALVKYQILDRNKNSFGLSMIGAYNQIGATNTPFHGVAPGPSLSLELALDKKMGRFLNSVNVGYIKASPGERINPALNFDPPETTLILSAGSQYSFSRNLKVATEVHSSFIDSDTDALDREALSLEGLLSVNYRFNVFKKNRVELNVGVTKGLNNGISTPSLRYFGGLSIGFGPQKPFYIVEENEDIEREVASLVESGDLEEPSVHDDDKSSYKKIGVNYVEFDFDSYSLDGKSQSIIDTLSRYIKQKKYKSIFVLGHADYVGTTEYNEILSLKRAEAVAQSLISKGIDSKNIDFNGFGKRRVRTTKVTGKALQKNRRVEIFILQGEKEDETI